jgi:uridylate kinase
MAAYKRVLLKLSGEALASLDPHGGTKQGIDEAMLAKMALDVKTAHDNGIQVCIVVGGGNIFRGVRGVHTHGIDRTTADHMGMMATVINGLALHHAIESYNVPCRIMSAIPMPTVCENYAAPRARHHLEKGRVVIFVAGTGNPYFTTDSAAALRACEMHCDLLLKATKVPGVFDKDPATHPDARFLKAVTYDDALTQRLNIMDATALALLRDNATPLCVFSLYEDNAFMNVLNHEGQFTLITSPGE